MSESSPEEEESSPEAHTAPPAEEERIRELTPIVGELVQTAVRRLVARSRAEFGRAAHAGRQRLEIRQQRKDLDHFWKRLGKTAYHLVEAGEVDHPALRKAMGRIDDLDAALKALPEQEQDPI
jgi:hypothetical protein